MMVLATDMGDMQRDLVESQKLLERIQHVMDGRGRVGIFPDLASQRTKSIEIDESAGRHPAEVRGQDPRRSSTRS